MIFYDKFASMLYMVAILQDVSSYLLLSSVIYAPERCVSCDLEDAWSGDGVVEKDGEEDDEQYTMGSYRMMGEEYSRKGSPPGSPSP